MDIQVLFNAMSDADLKSRSSYHLTYGGLIDALRAAPPDATFDSRVTGIGSYRGYYSDIALFTGEQGYSASDEDYDSAGDWSASRYDEWAKAHRVSADSIPVTAGELADLLEQLLGKGFEGYKGGWYEIGRDKPLWLENENNNCSQDAVVAISEDLRLVTKTVDS